MSGNSRSRAKKTDNQRTLLTASLSALVVIIILVVIFAKNNTADENFGDNPRINLVGREASSEYTRNTDDPEIRSSEEEKLSTVLELLAEKDWENANALFETIFPGYLDTCGKYNYYKAAVSLADSFEGFSVEREIVETRMNALSSHCNRLSLKGK